MTSLENKEKLMKDLKDNLTRTLNKDGNTIIACYPNERVIEILLMLHKLW